MAASLSILGLYEWNEGIFDNLELPDGIDRDILIPEIVTQCSDFCLLYPDYDFMRMLIGVWSKKEQRIWEDLLRSETFEYNPIENYDRYEEIEREATGSSNQARKAPERPAAPQTTPRPAPKLHTMKSHLPTLAARSTPAPQAKRTAGRTAAKAPAPVLRMYPPICTAI